MPCDYSRSAGRARRKTHTKQKLIPLVKALHDLGEHDAEYVGWRLAVIGDPAARSPSVDARKKRQVRFCLDWEGHLREVAEMDAMAADPADGTDISVRIFSLNSLVFCDGNRIPQKLPVNSCGSCIGTAIHNTHAVPPYSTITGDADVDRIRSKFARRARIVPRWHIDTAHP